MNYKLIMMHISRLFRRGEEAKIESTDIINIFKDRTDPVITEIDEYPIYVQELSYGGNTFH